MVVAAFVACRIGSSEKVLPGYCAAQASAAGTTVPVLKLLAMALSLTPVTLARVLPMDEKVLAKVISPPLAPWPELLSMGRAA